MLQYFGVALLLALFTIAVIGAIESFEGRRDRSGSEGGRDAPPDGHSSSVDGPRRHP